ncbi:MAG: DUF927 domain-containing protein [Candidatus Gastranaerophilales bacterium]|nr:DUF927 domain-containing protein [Candidatus Gastranaerophilales bacterium]
MTKLNENTENISIDSPIDLVKIDHDKFLEIIKPDILKCSFGPSTTKSIPTNVKIPSQRQIILAEENGIYDYSIKHSKTNKGYYCNIAKTVNAGLQDIKHFFIIHNNKTNLPTTAQIQLIFKKDDNTISEPVLLDEKAKSNFKDFDKAVHRTNNRILSNFNNTSFILFMEKLDELAKDNVYSLTNAGKVNYKNYKGRMYKNGYLDTDGTIIKANEYGEVKVGNEYLTLNKADKSYLPSIYTEDYDSKRELYKLLEQTEKVYKGKIEPFLCLGTAIMVIFLEEIWEELPGFPIVYLQGNTKQGKSLIQGIVANLFGYEKRMMSTGDSTDNAIARKCHKHNSIPICINDYDYFKSQSTSFENNVVNFYEAGVREKLYNGTDFNLQPISSTAIYSSNYLPCAKEKIFNRLLPLYFPDNGINTTAITNDYVKDIKRSRILAEVQKYGWEKIKNLYEKVEEHILGLDIFEGKDRESNNVAIAFTGLLVLESIAGYSFSNRDELLKEYCEWYNDTIKKRISPVENFLNLLPALFHGKYLKLNEHFKIKLIQGRVVFIFDTQECIKQYNNYCIQNCMHSEMLNPKTFSYDLKASEYYLYKTTEKYSGKQASSTILDITDSVNGKCFYSATTYDTHAEFSEKKLEVGKKQKITP